jgi:hypothetical protein
MMLYTFDATHAFGTARAERRRAEAAAERLRRARGRRQAPTRRPGTTPQISLGARAT